MCNILIDLVSVSIISSIVSVVWVLKLTTPQGLFGVLPNYYGGGIANKILSCEDCLSGWLSILFWFSFMTFNLIVLGFSFRVLAIGLSRVILGGFMGIYISSVIKKFA